MAGGTPTRRTISDLRFKLAVSWLFYSGCRVGEAIAADQRDVRFMSNIGLYGWSIPKTKTHNARHVWLPERLSPLLDESRQVNSPRPEWPMLWDCDGRGFGRVENPATRISPRTINGALDRARDGAGLQINVTAHVARHTYCTNWIKDAGQRRALHGKAQPPVGTSVAKLRAAYVHVRYEDSAWAHICNFGSPTKAGDE